MHYDIVLRDRIDGRIVERRAYVCADDGDAARRGHVAAADHDVEIWQAQRLVDVAIARRSRASDAHANSTATQSPLLRVRQWLQGRGKRNAPIHYGSHQLLAGRGNERASLA